MRHFEVPEQACGSDLLRREKNSCHQGITEVKVKWCPNCAQSLDGGPGEEWVCVSQSGGVCGDLLRGGQPWVVLTESLFVDESAAALGSTRTER